MFLVPYDTQLAHYEFSDANNHHNLPDLFINGSVQDEVLSPSEFLSESLSGTVNNDSVSHHDTLNTSYPVNNELFGFDENDFGEVIPFDFEAFPSSDVNDQESSVPESLNFIQESVVEPVKQVDFASPKKEFKKNRIRKVRRISNSSINNQTKSRIAITSTSKFPKPKLSYNELIRFALINHPYWRATVAQIYTFIAYNFPFYAEAVPKWKSTIRHNLSLKRFKKIDNNGLRCIWELSASSQKQMLEEAAKKGFYANQVRCLRPGVTFQAILEGRQGPAGEAFTTWFMSVSVPENRSKTTNGARRELGRVLTQKVV